MTEETLFALALEKSSAAERRAFLEAACGDDAALRRRVEQLLAADGRASGILDRRPDPAELFAVCEPDTAVADLPPGAGRARAVPEANPPGYALLEEVGEGGMGAVYRARDLELARDVAVKFLHARFEAGGPAARRFLGEARVTAQLQHPGIPPVHEVGSLLDGRPFLVMKLIRGRTLAELLADSQADRGRLLSAFEQVCQAVAFAHDRKVIHRDLKPSNVMVGSFGEVQVMDWGLAKVLAGREPERPEAATSAPDVTATAIDSDRGAGDETRAGSVLGTPAYMPPEQAVGAVDQIDQRSDVFGLGAILCAILTGKPPYVGADFEATRQMAARARLDDAFVRLDSCGADPGLVALGKRCLAAEPAGRPADAGEVARAVAGLRAAADERARQAELERAKAEAESREQRKRRRVQLALAVALGLLLIGAGAFAWYSDRRAAGRQAREAGTDASVKEALRDARERTEEAWAVSDYPERMQRAADAAEAAIRRAEGFAAGGSPTEGTLAELDAARPAVEEIARHARLITAHADTRQWYADEFNYQTDYRRYETEFCNRLAEELRQFGLDPVNGPADEVARTVAASRIRDPLLGVLLEWHQHALSLSEMRRTYPDRSDFTLTPRLARDQLGPVIRSARLMSGGAYARWQNLLDGKDVPGLVTFAGSAGGLSFRSTLVRALGQDLTSAGQYPACRAFLRAAVDRYPHDVWLHFDLYRACRDMQPPDHAESLHHMSAASALQPNSARFYLEVGSCCHALRSYDQAAAAYRKSIALRPDSFTAYLNLGITLRDKQDWDGAIAAFRETVRLRPYEPRANAFLVTTLARAGRHAEARQAPLDTLRRNPALAEPGSAFRLNAAGDAIDCANLQGENPPPPAEREAYRKQALDLLCPLPTAYRTPGAADRTLVHRRLQSLLEDRTFASVRDPAALEQLPPDERAAWEKFWADSRELAARTAPPNTDVTPHEVAPPPREVKRP